MDLRRPTRRGSNLEWHCGECMVRSGQRIRRVSADLVWRWIGISTAKDMQENLFWHPCWKHWQKCLKNLICFRSVSRTAHAVEENVLLCRVIHSFAFWEDFRWFQAKLKPTIWGEAFSAYKFVFGIQTWNSSKLLQIKVWLSVCDIESPYLWEMCWLSHKYSNSQTFPFLLRISLLYTI